PITQHFGWGYNCIPMS
ncbi:MAG: hypothetical protein EZS28_050956, partial [Streblomastix strix]